MSAQTLFLTREIHTKEWHGLILIAICLEILRSTPAKAGEHDPAQERAYLDIEARCILCNNRDARAITAPQCNRGASESSATERLYKPAARSNGVRILDESRSGNRYQERGHDHTDHPGRRCDTLG